VVDDEGLDLKVLTEINTNYLSCKEWQAGGKEERV